MAPSKEGGVRKVSICGGDPALWVGDSPRNHREIEAAVRELLVGERVRPPPADAVAEEEAHWQDMEIFFGKDHLYKNVENGATSCGDGACIVHRPPNVRTATLDAHTRPAASGLTVYGAGWCRHCRAAKALLEAISEAGVHGTAYRYVDVEALGGPAAVLAALEVARQSTIPIAYADGELLGGFEALAAFLAPAEGAPAADVATHAQRIARSREMGQGLLLSYNKAHTATISLLHGWGMQSERIVSRAEGADLEGTLTLERVAPGAAITVYAVGGPDVRAACVVGGSGDSGGGGGGGSDAIGGGGSGCGELGGGTSLQLLSISPPSPATTTPCTLATPVAGRHLVACVPNGSTLRLRAANGLCLYALYVTNEPPSMARAQPPPGGPGSPGSGALVTEVAPPPWTGYVYSALSAAIADAVVSTATDASPADATADVLEVIGRYVMREAAWQRASDGSALVMP